MLLSVSWFHYSGETLAENSFRFKRLYLIRQNCSHFHF